MALSARVGRVVRLDGRSLESPGCEETLGTRIWRHGAPNLGAPALRCERMINRLRLEPVDILCKGHVLDEVPIKDLLAAVSIEFSGTFDGKVPRVVLVVENSCDGENKVSFIPAQVFAH